MKRTMILLSEKPDDLEATIRSAFPEHELVCTSNIDRIITIIHDDMSVWTILIDVPSRIPDVRRLIDIVSEGNNYVHAIAVLLLTEPETLNADIAFLGGSAVDLIYKPLNPVILANRLSNADQQINSVSFGEFARMLKALPANIYLKDAEGRYVFSSQTWSHLDTGDDPDWTIRGKTDIEIRKDKENAKLAMKTDIDLLKNKKGVSYIIEENTNGQEYLQLIKEPLFFPDGRVRGIIALINNVTEQERMRRELRERSIRDQLTGMYNRTYLDEYLQELRSREKYPISIISADCDRLKMVNDTYGHMIGDTYIKLCVALMCDVLPKDSCIFRMGGDEFMAFLPETGAQKTMQYIEKMRELAHSYTIHDVALSVSMGCSTMESPLDSVVDCIKRSDSDMYRNKRKKKESATA